MGAAIISKPSFDFLHDYRYGLVAHPAVRTLLNRGLEGLEFDVLLLIATDRFTDAFAVVGEIASRGLCLDPPILLVGQGDGLSYVSHAISGGCVGVAHHRRTIAARSLLRFKAVCLHESLYRIECVQEKWASGERQRAHRAYGHERILPAHGIECRVRITEQLIQIERRAG